MSLKEYYVDEICKLLFLLKTEFVKDEREQQERKSKIILIKGNNKEATDNDKQVSTNA